MAVEKMVMMNVIGLKTYMNDIAREMTLMGNVDVVNALNEIRSSHFTLSVEEENVEELVDMTMIRPIIEERDYDQLNKKITDIRKMCDEDFQIKRKYFQESYDFEKNTEDINQIHRVLKEPYDEIIALKEEINRIDEFYENFMYMKDLDIEIESLSNLHYFTYIFGTLAKENRLKLKKNYENITAIVLHTGSSDIGEVYLVISPKELEIETNRILRSLNFHEIKLPNTFTGTPFEITKKLEERKIEIQKTLSVRIKDFLQLKKKYLELMEACYSRLKMEEKVKELKKQMVSTTNFFYLSGWVPERQKEKIRDNIERYEGSIVMFKENENVDHDLIPPTKLNNNWLFRPFEFLVEMYGIPSYNELDPTAFLSLTYMMLFGAMFGDLGQGFILFLIGWYLKGKMKDSPFGPILNRLGISSMFFGLLYGSVFGFEEWIHALLIKPFENINLVLMAAVGIGIFLLLLSYLYSIINAIKQRDLKEGLFGRNGVTGLLFYTTLLIMVGSTFLERALISINMGLVILVLLTVLMVVKEPLTNLIQNRRPLYHEDISSYYIESGFEILETLLNMLSSTVSFIRVGAFALTHVGLFLAFQTIARLLDNLPASIIVLIIGNIVIIGLEGLIVSIQGLRLEYYELFSKYYRGEGVAFNPIELEGEKITH